MNVRNPLMTKWRKRTCELNIKCELTCMMIKVTTYNNVTDTYFLYPVADLHFTTAI